MTCQSVQQQSFGLTFKTAVAWTLLALQARMTKLSGPHSIQVASPDRQVSDLYAFCPDTGFHILLESFIHHLCQVLAVFAFTSKPYKQHPHMYTKHVELVYKFLLQTKDCIANSEHEHPMRIAGNSGNRLLLTFIQLWVGRMLHHCLIQIFAACICVASLVK